MQVERGWDDNKITRCGRGNWIQSQSMTSHAGILVHDRGDDANMAVENTGDKPLGIQGVIASSRNMVSPSFNVPQPLCANRRACLAGASHTLLVALAAAGNVAQCCRV
jgi:hypothetical protein